MIKIGILTVAAVMMYFCLSVCGEDFPEDGWFDFNPPADPFTEDALVDFTVPGRAGNNGWVQIKGDNLALEKTGEQIRFLSVNGPVPWSGTWGDSSKRKYLAKRLAKTGVNHMRIGPVRGAHKINESNLDGMKELIAACADQGIYSGIWFYYPLETRNKNITSTKDLHCLVYFHPEARRQYDETLKRVMTTPNPHSGKPLAEDPAVAYVELVNEDGLFFYNFAPSKKPEPIRAVIENRFADWLKEKYGSFEKAYESWGGKGRDKADQPEQNRMRVYDAFMFMDEDWAYAQRDELRAADTLRFLVNVQQTFYNEVQQQLRSWGYKGLVVATNWTTTNQQKLSALEKYANSVCGLFDRHAYFSGTHKPAKKRNWLVDPGDHYKSSSQLLIPDMHQRGIYYKDHPQFLSEHFYPAPNRFRAEMVWMAAFYSCAYGLDGFSINEFHTHDWIGKPLKRFDAFTPVFLGQYPGAAAVYRAGVLKEEEPVVRVKANPENLYNLEGTPVWESMKLDPQNEFAAGSDKGDQKIDPLAWMVGPVEMEFTDSETGLEVEEVSDCINRDESTVQTKSGDLEWNWKKGLVTAKSPLAQGVCGFLEKAGEIDLPDVAIESRNEYATVWVVSLDGKPISESRRILLQAVTEQRTKGWKEEPAEFTKGKSEEKIQGFKILDVGTGPQQVRNIRMHISLKRPDAGELKVATCDHNGYKKEVLSQGTDKIVLKPDVLWYIISKE